MKITGLIGLSILFMCVIGFSGLHYLNKINSNAKQIYQDNMIPNELLNQIIINNAVIDGLQLEMMIGNNHTAERQKGINDSLGTIVNESIAILKQLETIGMTGETKQLFDAFKNKIGASDEARNAMLAKLAANQTVEAYNVYNNELKPVRSEIMNTLVSIKELNKESTAQLNEINKKDAAASKRNLILLLLASLIVCGTVSVLLSRMITSPLGQLKTLMQDAQNGDLSVKGNYVSKDEIGVLTTGFNDMISSLRDIIAKIGLHSEMLSTSSEELLASSAQTSEASSHIAEEIQEVADGSNVQFNSARECTRAMDEVAAGIQRVAQSAADVSGIAQHTTGQALLGSDKIKLVSGQLDSILLTSQASAAVIKKLDMHSQEIGNIVDIIKGISGQINLLALNASIEAARAGEHGRGFAVVAQEVRKLAEQSNHSSEQISTIITEIQASTAEAVQMMDKESSEINHGLQGMLEAKHSFEEIVGSIQEVNQQLEEVSAASEQISASSQEVSASLQVTEGIAGSSFSKTKSVAAASEEQMATMEEVGEAVKALAVMAEELQELSSRFRI